MIAPRPLVFLSALWIAGALASPLGAQDTRGSLLPGSPVALIDGTTVTVEDLRVGDRIWTWDAAGSAVAGKVTAIRRQNTDSYYELKVGEDGFDATGSQRVVLADGRSVRLDTIKARDVVQYWPEGAKAAEPRIVTRVRVLPATIVAFDLTVEGHRWFRIGGFMVGD